MCDRQLNLRVKINAAKLDLLCQTWQISELSLFGSVLSDRFHEDSDIDVLVEFSPESQIDFIGFFELQEELSDLFDRPVDLVSKRGILRSQNIRRRDEILNSAKVIYEKSRARL